MSEMRDWFFLRSGFDNFKIDPRHDRRILIGDYDRKRRDQLLTMLDGAARAAHGQKAVIYGDYGRGKTHLCHNLLYEVERKKLRLAPAYVKCTEFESKEKFSTLFRDMILGHDVKDLRRIAVAYKEKIDAKTADPLSDVIGNDDIAEVMTEGLIVPSDHVVKRCMRWLGGDAKVDMSAIEKTHLAEQLTTGREFAGVLRGLAHMYRIVDNHVLLYLVDEAERVEGVTHADTFTSWKSAFREITEEAGVAMLFLVGAKSRNELPVLFVQHEIMRRIGSANYTELLNPSKEQLHEFLLEVLRVKVRKGEVPEAHWDALEGDALDGAVPKELTALTGNDPKRLDTYPFEPDAFETFVEHLLVAEFGNKPSEALERLQKAAQLAHTSDKRTIDQSIVTAIQSEGF